MKNQTGSGQLYPGTEGTSAKRLRAPRAKPNLSWPYPQTNVSNRIRGILPEKQMNIFKRIAAYLFFNRDEYDVLCRYNEAKHDAIEVDNSGDSRENIEGEDSFRFDVIAAAGGTIVQTRHYDKRNDQHVRKLHIIGSDEDMPTALAHILALEQLGR